MAGMREAGLIQHRLADRVGDDRAGRARLHQAHRALDAGDHGGGVGRVGPAGPGDLRQDSASTGSAAPNTSATWSGDVITAIGTSSAPIQNGSAMMAKRGRCPPGRARPWP